MEGFFMNKKTQSILRLIFCLAVTFTAAGIGSLGMAGDDTWQWYERLNKPFFQPPDWLFGPVWTVLYILMAVAVFLVWQKGFDKKAVRVAMSFFAIQLALNAFWTIIFFGLGSILEALVEIVVLWAAIVVTTIQFKKASTAASILMLPYLVWVSFAVLLNAFLYILNR
jgi:benzodiazapine receptor